MLKTICESNLMFYRFVRLESGRAHVVKRGYIFFTSTHTGHTRFCRHTVYRLQTQNVHQLNVVLKIYYTNIS